MHYLSSELQGLIDDYPETVIMCGAALEAALEDFTQDVEEQIRKRFKDKLKDRQDIPVWMRREYLRETGVLSKALADKAKEVSKARNDAPPEFDDETKA